MRTFGFGGSSSAPSYSPYVSSTLYDCEASVEVLMSIPGYPSPVSLDVKQQFNDLLIKYMNSSAVSYISSSWPGSESGSSSYSNSKPSVWVKPNDQYADGENEDKDVFPDSDAISDGPNKRLRRTLKFVDAQGDVSGDATGDVVKFAIQVSASSKADLSDVNAQILDAFSAEKLANLREYLANNGLDSVSDLQLTSEPQIFSSGCFSIQMMADGAGKPNGEYASSWNYEEEAPSSWSERHHSASESSVSSNNEDYDYSESSSEMSESMSYSYSSSSSSSSSSWSMSESDDKMYKESDHDGHTSKDHATSGQNSVSSTISTVLTFKGYSASSLDINMLKGSLAEYVHVSPHCVSANINANRRRLSSSGMISVSLSVEVSASTIDILNTMVSNAVNKLASCSQLESFMKNNGFTHISGLMTTEPTSTPPKSNVPSKSDAEKNVIIGATIGGFAFVVIVASVAFVMVKRARASRVQMTQIKQDTTAEPQWVVSVPVSNNGATQSINGIVTVAYGYPVANDAKSNDLDKQSFDPNSVSYGKQ